MKQKIHTGREKGNALFLILIAVALFAALSYVITTSSRGTGSIDTEKAIVLAARITDISAVVRSSVTRILALGIAGDQITFTGADTASDAFSSDLSTEVLPPPEACLPECTGWVYAGFTDTTHGLFVGGVKTDAPETMLVLPDVTEAVCRQIQKGLGFASAVPPEQDTAAFDWTDITGAISQAGGLKGSATTVWAPGLTGHEFACVDNRGGGYFYYHVLLPQ
jgi:hypothetical protein